MGSRGVVGSSHADALGEGAKQDSGSQESHLRENRPGGHNGEIRRIPLEVKDDDWRL